MRGRNPHGVEAGTKRFVDPFAPCDVTPRVSRADDLGESLAPAEAAFPCPRSHQRRRSTLPGPRLAAADVLPSAKPDRRTDPAGISSGPCPSSAARNADVDPVSGVRNATPSGRPRARAGFADLVDATVCGLDPEDDRHQARRRWPAELDRPPDLRKIAPKGDRQLACSLSPTTTPQSTMPCCRSARSTVGDANGMNALLRESRCRRQIRHALRRSILRAPGEQSSSNLPPQGLRSTSRTVRRPYGAARDARLEPRRVRRGLQSDSTLLRSPGRCPIAVRAIQMAPAGSASLMLDAECSE